MTTWHIANGYRFAGVHSGLRANEPGRLDLALIVSDRPAVAAGVFTQNRVCAAPVHVCRERLPTKEARGIVVCSGNANACTGQQGLDDARHMTALAGQALGVDAKQMLVCSTGVIGRLLPMAVMESGIPAAAKDVATGPEALERAARAILTTDTRVKVRTRQLVINGQQVNITGFAKGAAMIGPNMATMLAFVLTDAPLDVADLQALAPIAADRSFNCISVEGHTSTNDSLIFLANGDGPKLKGDALRAFNEAAIGVCEELARDMASDAEGASHLITIHVEGTRNDAEARTIAKTIAESALVKTAFFGADPNWGRIVSAAGYSGIAFDESQLSLRLGDFLLYEKGTPLPFDPSAVSAFMKANRELTIRLIFTLGAGRCTFYTCDLTYDYVRLNADYTT
ncbi:MAG: bifunctional glutamate N-acetyltransferase/amino-acid acetyltransferase ArgJ [Planctomycetes bacterium]|nr:bifunctional glutamate N-acetyltransferase/amino-acid acetyltransferase ArgJ [Planctomycetota bacterium]